MARASETKQICFHFYVISQQLSRLLNDEFFVLQGYSPLGSPGMGFTKNEVLKNPILLTVAEKMGKTSAQVALRWGLQTGHSVLPKSTNEARIKENLDVLDWSIPEDLFAKLSEIEQASTLFLYIYSFESLFDNITMSIKLHTTSCHWFLRCLELNLMLFHPSDKCFDQNVMCKMDLWIISQPFLLFLKIRCKRISELFINNKQDFTLS